MAISTSVFLLAILTVTRPSPFVNADDISNCFDTKAGFSKEDWKHCQPIAPNLFLYYTPPDDVGNAMLGLHAPGHTEGWSALALAGNGGMKGASQIVVRKDEDNGGEWVAEDRYSDDYTTPALDEIQDVELLFARQNEENGTSWGVAVRANSCDEHDYPVEDRSTWMHWALGSGHSFGFHDDRRGQFHANLMRAPPSALATVEPRSIEEEVIEIFDIRMPDVPVIMGEGGQDPRNPYVCSFFDLEELKKEHEDKTGHDLDSTAEKVHITQFSPFLDPDSTKYVHHMILFECLEEYAAEEGYEHQKIVPECQSMPNGCWEVKWPWAVGSQDVIFPDDVGMPAGGKTGNRWMLLQMHYYNPNLDKGVKDSSGVRVHFTTDLRPVDAGVMQINGGTASFQRDPIPAGQPSVVLPSFVVPSTCTEEWGEPINVLGVMHHEHLSGKKVTIEVEREGRNLGPMRLERRFDFNHQSLEESSIPQLLPGDQMVMTCEYDTSDRAEDVEFGDLSQQEMCWAAVMYYPRKPGKDTLLYMPAHSEQKELFETVCSSHGVGEDFIEVSLCAQSYFTDIPTFFQLSDLADIDTSFGAADLCNSPMYESMFEPFFPNSCPPCAADKSCADEEVLAWGQDVVCVQRCEQFGGLSVYPDNTTTSASVTHGAWCDFEEPIVYFEHTPSTPKTCEIRGDLSAVTPQVEKPGGTDGETVPASDGSGAVPMALRTETVFAAVASTFLVFW